MAADPERRVGGPRPPAVDPRRPIDVLRHPGPEPWVRVLVYPVGSIRRRRREPWTVGKDRSTSLVEDVLDDSERDRAGAVGAADLQSGVEFSIRPTLELVAPRNGARRLGGSRVG